MKIHVTTGNGAPDPAIALAAACADSTAIAALAHGYAVERFRVETSFELASIPVSYRVECILGLIDSSDFDTVVKHELRSLDKDAGSAQYGHLRELFVATFAPHERHAADAATLRLIPTAFRMPEAEATNLFIDTVGRDRFPADFDADGWTLAETYAELCRLTYLAENPQTVEATAELEADAVAPADAAVQAEAESEIVDTVESAPALVDDDAQVELVESASQATTPLAADPPTEETTSLDADVTAEPAVEVPEAKVTPQPTQPSKSAAAKKAARKKKKPAGGPLKLYVVDISFWDIMYGCNGIASLTMVKREWKFSARGETGPVSVPVFKRTEIPPHMFDR
ncbi:hypothetical protein H9P43_001522 [Blastocladiella emersonii ATCC 22665]|nr:hypothetical protein H9P43_001522 [Blastocladiella emersonii ATCC 22665]